MRKFTLLVAIFFAVFAAGCISKTPAEKLKEENKQKAEMLAAKQEGKRLDAELAESEKPAPRTTSVSRDEMNQKIADAKAEAKKEATEEARKELKLLEARLADSNAKIQNLSNKVELLEKLAKKLSEPIVPILGPKREVPLRDSDLPADLRERIATREAEQKFELEKMDIAHRAEVDKLKVWLARFDLGHKKMGPDENFIGTRREKAMDLLTLEAEFKKDRAIKVAKFKTEIEGMKKP